MILIDLIPPGLTFQALVGPVQGTRAQPPASPEQVRRALGRSSQSAGAEDGAHSRHRAPQSYRIWDMRRAQPSEATALPRAPPGAPDLISGHSRYE
jgi:hypothetical protein